MRGSLFFIIAFIASNSLHGQGCCSGGSGCPIAGGSSPGVLLAKQIEIGSSFQYINGNKFLARDKDTISMFDNFNSKYVYSRLAYGVTKDLTVSVEAGYFINKTQIGLNKMDTLKSSGIGDLILFPKYDVYNRVDEKKRIDFTLGLGYKIPLGKHDDSTLVYTNPNTGHQTFTTSPPIVQPTTGSQDFIFYAFFFRGFSKKQFRIYSNATYIKKGWNSLGEKFGDYASLGLFAGKTFFECLGITLQVKGEWIGKLKQAKNEDLVAFYNLDLRSTGSKKIFFVPQVSYSFKSFIVYALGEIPIYQYVNGAQVVTAPITAGVSYRFFSGKKQVPKPGETYYECPMKCAGSISKEPGKCPMCGMELVPQILK
jgi:hypothetical protein